MNKPIIYLAILGLGVLFSFSSCKKETEEEIEENNPMAGVVTFSISNPLSMSTYGLGEIVDIDIMLSADVEFHGYDIELIKVSNDSIVWDLHEHDHGTTFHIHEEWVNDLTTHSDMELKVRAYLDHDGDNIEEESVMFHCHPM